MGAKRYSNLNVQLWELMGWMVGFLVVAHFGTRLPFLSLQLSCRPVSTYNCGFNSEYELFVSVTIMDPVVFSMTKS